MHLRLIYLATILAIVAGTCTPAYAQFFGAPDVPACTLAAGDDQLSIAGSTSRTCGTREQGRVAAVIDAVGETDCSDIPGAVGGGSVSLFVQWDGSKGASGEWKCVPAELSGAIGPSDLGQEAATEGQTICWDDGLGEWGPCSNFPTRIAWVAIPGAPTDPNQLYRVTNALGRCDISTSGTEEALILWDGSAWVPACDGSGGGGGGVVTGIAATTGGTTSGAVVTVVGAGTNSTSRAGDTITITGTGDGQGVSGIAASTGGTATGSTVTLVGSGDTTTSRSGDTITINSSGGAGVSTGLKGDVNVVGADTDWQLVADSVTGAEIANDAVGATEIATGAVGNAELANDAVTTAKILDSTIGAADLATSSVTTAKILDGTILSTDLATSSVTSAKILDGDVANADLGANSVTSAKIADGTIIAGDLASDSVTTTKILNANVTAAKLATDSVTATQIAADAVGSSEIAAGAVTTSEILDGTIVAADLAVPPGTQSTAGVTHPVSATDDLVVGGTTCAGAAVCVDESTGDIISRVPGGRIITEPDTTNPGAISIEEPSGVPGDNYASIEGTTAGFAANYRCVIEADGTLTPGLGCMFADATPQIADFIFRTSGTQVIDADEYDVEPVDIDAIANVIIGNQLSLSDQYVCNPNVVITPPATYTTCTVGTEATDCSAYSPTAGSCVNYGAMDVPAGTYLVDIAVDATFAGDGDAVGNPDCARMYLYGLTNVFEYPVALRFFNGTAVYSARGLIEVSSDDLISPFMGTCVGSFDPGSITIQRATSRVLLQRVQ